MQPGSKGVELLACLVDPDGEDEDEYRVLVNGKDVKYVTVDAGALPAETHRSFAPDVLRVLPELPPGDWTKAHISKDDRTGRPIFSAISTESLPAVQSVWSVWHPTIVDHLELKTVTRLRSNIHEVTHVLFPEPVIFKLALFPWQIQHLEAETRAYEWIRNVEVGPRFLGHVSEGGRIVGFLMENITRACPATLDDLEACKIALAQLHSLGILHGDVNRNNFLIQQPADKAMMIDFETAEKCDEQDKLQAEVLSLAESFKDPSNRGGVIVMPAE